MNEKEETPVETQLDQVVRMSQGNPGAVSVLAKLVQDDDEYHIGPQAITVLDEGHIYGPDIWVLWKDICEQDLNRLYFTIGLTSYDTLRSAIEAAR